MAAVDLYWLPLGAGGHSVRLNGRTYEAFAAWHAGRPRCDLYHSALEVTARGGRFVVEMAPVPDGQGVRRGVVAEGPVGARWAGRLRVFRYEVRRWPGGEIPDVAEAVGGAQRLTRDERTAERLLDLVPRVPTYVWGRDEVRAGDMWNSNSVVAWLIVRSGIELRNARLPARGRAPGWQAGIVVAGAEAAPSTRAG